MLIEYNRPSEITDSFIHFFEAMLQHTFECVNVSIQSMNFGQSVKASFESSIAAALRYKKDGTPYFRICDHMDANTAIIPCENISSVAHNSNTIMIDYTDGNHVSLFYIPEG